MFSTTKPTWTVAVVLYDFGSHTSSVISCCEWWLEPTAKQLHTQPHLSWSQSGWSSLISNTHLPLSHRSRKWMPFVEHVYGVTFSTFDLGLLSFSFLRSWIHSFCLFLGNMHSESRWKTSSSHSGTTWELQQCSPLGQSAREVLPDNSRSPSGMLTLTHPVQVVPTPREDHAGNTQWPPYIHPRCWKAHMFTYDLLTTPVVWGAAVMNFEISPTDL